MSAGGQNRSHAVMAQRAEPHDSLDDFPTPPWGTRALVEHVLIGHGWRADNLAAMSVWEPACNRGFMARPLAEYFAQVHTSDVHDYGFGGCSGLRDSAAFAAGVDFLLPGRPLVAAPDWVVTNPPFRLAAEFALRGMEVARQGVALLVRTAFVESVERYQTLFRPHPPLLEAVFVERLAMVKGRCDPKASTATSYAWIVWPGRDFVRTDHATRRLWIPPCRKRLERAGDYREPGAMVGEEAAGNPPVTLGGRGATDPASLRPSTASSGVDVAPAATARNGGAT